MRVPALADYAGQWHPTQPRSAHNYSVDDIEIANLRQDNLLGELLVIEGFDLTGEAQHFAPLLNCQIPQVGDGACSQSAASARERRSSQRLNQPATFHD